MVQLLDVPLSYATFLPAQTSCCRRWKSCIDCATARCWVKINEMNMKETVVGINGINVIQLVVTGRKEDVEVAGKRRESAGSYGT